MAHKHLKKQQPFSAERTIDEDSNHLRREREAILREKEKSVVCEERAELVYERIRRRTQFINTAASAASTEEMKRLDLRLEDLMKHMGYSEKIFQAIGTKTCDIERKSGFSSATLADWRHFVLEQVLDHVELTSSKIGGVGKVVVVDKSKFGERKFHKGRHVEGQWVFGSVERDSGKLFLVDVHDRTQ
ncbi:DDE_Tnp_IS1595 domain-containing protein [Trichonephila clavipes]|nr:DDE_Tnp_IS1595 domain-containing protein [Trichonephila clavipes]